MGNGTALQILVRKIRLRIFNIKATLGISEYYAEKNVVGVELRNSILKKIAQCQDIESNFILHNKYKAGVKTRNSKEEQMVRTSFYENMLHSDYIVCVRGRGNFSVRFYETLSMGRIPIVYDTEQLFPYKDELDYSKVGLFINSLQHAIDELPALIVEYHRSLSPEEFQAIQRNNRELWINFMSSKGVVSNFSKL